MRPTPSFLVSFSWKEGISKKSTSKTPKKFFGKVTFKGRKA
jgi:hypothetical protein